MKEAKRWVFGRIVKKLEGDMTTPYVKLTNIPQIEEEEDLEKAKQVMEELASTNYVLHKHKRTWRLVEDHWANYRDRLGIDKKFAEGIVQRKGVEL